MDKYTVKLLPRAFRDTDQVYGHIAEESKTPETAKNMVDEIALGFPFEKTGINLDFMNEYAEWHGVSLMPQGGPN